MAARSLNRLSRESILELVRVWLRDARCSPYLVDNRNFLEADEEDYLHAPAKDVEALRAIYRNLKINVNACTKRDIIDRIVDGDWRRGLSLHQHAMIDMAYLEQTDTAYRWSALHLVPLESEESKMEEPKQCHNRRKRRKLNDLDSDPKYPQTSAPTFLAALKAEISPLVKAHYHLHRLPAPYNLSIIRLYISSVSTFQPCRSKIPRRAKHATDAARVMYIALPESCPYIYISLSGSTGANSRAKSSRNSRGKMTTKVDIAAMKKIIIEAIPKALSRPQQRWALESTKLTVRSLHSIAALRGSSDPGTGGGAYSEFCSVDTSSTTSPVDVQSQKEIQGGETILSVERRFGSMAGTYHAALDRVHVAIQDVARTDEPNDADMEGIDAVPIGLNFSGNDVFSGLKKLAELGTDYLNLDKMPAWMTGELGISSLKV
jgi:central kinetochore subunit Mis15/CHL4